MRFGISGNRCGGFVVSQSLGQSVTGIGCLVWLSAAFYFVGLRDGERARNKRKLGPSGRRMKERFASTSSLLSARVLGRVVLAVRQTPTPSWMRIFMALQWMLHALKYAVSSLIASVALALAEHKLHAFCSFFRCAQRPSNILPASQTIHDSDLRCYHYQPRNQPNLRKQYTYFNLLIVSSSRPVGTSSLILDTPQIVQFQSSSIVTARGHRFTRFMTALHNAQINKI